MDQPTLSYSDEALRPVPVDLTNCDREPIHLPGAVQPYGFLLCLHPTTEAVVQASENTVALIGIPAEELVSAGLARLLAPPQVAALRPRFATLGTATQLLGICLEEVAGQPYYKLMLHRFDGLLWLEFEPVATPATTTAHTLDLGRLSTAISGMLEAGSVEELCRYAAEQVAELTGFDRVSVYRFAPDESGEVVAEVRCPTLDPPLDSWLGLHYPATDIPQQARVMYLKNWLRFIADAGYTPAHLVPATNPVSGRPPDMTHAALRSVSPIHLEYLRNMGVAASMSISLIQDGRLWGLILCHHLTPRLVSYELRDLCQFVGKTFSALITGKEQLDVAAYQHQVSHRQRQLLARVAQEADFIDALRQCQPALHEVFACGGAAVCFDGELTLLGTTPAPEQIGELVAWLRAHAAPQEIFATDSWAQLYPAAAAMATTASGVLAAPLSAQGDYLLWFRPEEARTITWAGKNEKPERLADGALHLSPRRSFAAWKETVGQRALPWLPLELVAAADIRQRVIGRRLQAFHELQARAYELSQLNTELSRSNEELDAFAYVASHDLKEPLRGIHNYAVFLLEDYAAQLDAEGVDKLQTLVRLSKRMESLIEALLQLSRVGRADLELREVTVADLLTDLLDTLGPRLAETGTTVRVAVPLPIIRADGVRLQEVFYNLVTNAMRYNDRPEKRVEIGEATPDMPGAAGRVNFQKFHVFYVRDNGIGIDSRHHDVVFRIFKRLHHPSQYGGGTGAGLTIARKMLERHGGELWLESAPGAGTTFFFSVSRHL